MFYKYRRQIEIAKAKLMEKHLDILVENTERLTKLLVSNMIETRESDLESMQSDNDPLITLVSEDDEEDEDVMDFLDKIDFDYLVKLKW